MTDVTSQSTDSSRTTLALALSGVGLVVFLIAMFQGDDAAEWLWPVAGVLGLAGAIAGWTAGRPRPQGRSLIAVVVGGLVAAFIIGWMIWAAATGNF